MAGSTIRRGPWDLNRKGSIDQERHSRRLKEALVRQLPTIVGETPVITREGDGVVRVPVKVLDLPRFRHREPRPEEVTGEGQGARSPGDVVASIPRQGEGTGAGEPGDAEHEHTVEVEMDLDTLAALVFEDLALPPLKPKVAGRMRESEWVWNSRRRHGPYATLDRKATLKAALARNAAQGHPGLNGFSNEDLRYRSYTPVEEPVTNAVVVLIRDVSGSMTDDKKYLARALSFWLVRWIRLFYRDLKLEFLAHDTRAFWVDEAAFFTLSAGGGTRSAAAYRALGERMEEAFPPDRWNIYAFHFTDGEDWGPEEARGALEGLLPALNLFGLVELAPERFHARLGEILGRLPNPPVVTVRIDDKTEIMQGLKRLLGSGGGDEAHAG
ncbi:conserved protein of unknown function [Candidatus Hydrogenisulfobacillus filiaventi]|uniref:Sporulation protein YhbH n=1 Tax=Candidatus Hydrogenisulfobacillus filiaventi TaxID=2707344 RepID=A0A6F8ZGM5_9FIRM|nr:conserved protein of unknown function [Candidatus Hydrogenisulfobacillus filiaventi]